MARPDPWRSERARYPFASTVPTRFGDMDVLGHINNVAMAAIIEEGRIAFNRSLRLERSSADVRWLIAAVDIAYLAEAHYPEPVTVASGLGRIGTSSWTLLHAAFQRDCCVATCDTAIVYTDKQGARPFPEHYRAIFGANGAVAD